MDTGSGILFSPMCKKYYADRQEDSKYEQRNRKAPMWKRLDTSDGCRKGGTVFYSVPPELSKL